MKHTPLCHILRVAVPVVNIAGMREWEAATWATGQTEAAVIRRVGQRIASRIHELTKPGESILILAGKGHNGGDARATKDSLVDRSTKLLELIQPETELARLESALREKPRLIVDGLFGIGLNRPLSEPWQALIAAVNAANTPVLAVDVPSGFNAETGETFGAAIKAEITLTIGAPKAGMFAPHAANLVGRLEVITDVGLVPCPLKNDLNWTLPEDFENYPPRRSVESHKGTYGHAVIVAGSMGFHGASVLATRGAQRAQSGLTTLYTQENVYLPIASQLQSAMVQAWKPDLKFPEKTTSLLVGPGLAARDVPDALRKSVYHWWRDFEHPMVVDASGLDFLTNATQTRKAHRVVTPHPGEAARLLNSTTEKVQANRLAALRELSKKSGNCWVVLKGHQTLIGRSEGEVFVNPSGNPHLAQGGSGDVLAGFITGLLAQPGLQKDVGMTLRYAVWQHGAVADRLQAAKRNWTIEDLAGELGNVVA